MRDHGRYEAEGEGWSARERTIIARTEQFLERSFSVKVRVEELGGLLFPEDVDVDFMRILKKQETKEVEPPGGRWLSGRDGTSTEERHGDKIRRHLQEMDGGKHAWDSLRNRR